MRVEQGCQLSKNAVTCLVPSEIFGPVLTYFWLVQSIEYPTVWFFSHANALYVTAPFTYVSGTPGSILVKQPLQ